jgi:hypothetical protein
MVFHNVFQLKNQGESPKTPPHALLIKDFEIFQKSQGDTLTTGGLMIID